MAPGRNVLLMIADDLGRQLGSYGDPMKATPNLDHLAADGVRFTKAFASTASCSTSRSTIYTGQHNHQSGQYGLHSQRHHFCTFDHIESGPALLNAHGYLTGIVGKVHVGPDRVYPWTVREESTTRDVAYISDRCAAFFDKAVSEAKPFFLTVGFIDPHRDRTRSGFGNDDDFDERVKRNRFDPAAVPIPQFLSDGPGVRQEMASYYESINRMDQGVGFILQELQSRGLADDTLVFFMSDNGPPFINSKTTLYDAGINLPFLKRSPEGPSGVTNPNMVSYVDVLPTILDWTKHPTSVNPDPSSPRLGRSILPILSSTEELQTDWDKVYGSHTFHEITNYWPTRFVRTRRYKYHRNLAWRLDFPMAADIYGSLAWEDVRNSEDRTVGGRRLRDYFFRPPEELYDLEADPREVHNLVEKAKGDETTGEVLRDLRAKLEAWQRRTEDPWLYKDGISLLFVKHHVDAGMRMPDRADFEPDEPQSKGVNAVTDTSFGAGVVWER